MTYPVCILFGHQTLEIIGLQFLIKYFICLSKETTYKNALLFLYLPLSIVT
jgi:hypothetical protein